MSEAKVKIREQWLREELRASRTLITSLMQWGLTVLAAVALNLYYIRKDVHTHLVSSNIIQANEILPITRWLLGTAFLTLLAAVFTSYGNRFSAHHGHYRQLLLDMNGGYSGIKERVPRARLLYHAPLMIFFCIPLLDLAVWFLFYAGEKLNFSISW
jgi:hypothetical protein